MIMDCWGGAKIRCEFSKTQINTDNIVLKTIFHNVPDSTLYVKPETIRKEKFISHFRDSMEYCIYPEMPKNTKHWIVKLEDNWYLYDGYILVKDHPNILLDFISVICKLEKVKTQKQAIKMSQYIIEHKDLIIPFFEQHYQKCLEKELYWKQNMPYYKKE